MSKRTNAASAASIIARLASAAALPSAAAQASAIDLHRHVLACPRCPACPAAAPAALQISYYMLFNLNMSPLPPPLRPLCALTVCTLLAPQLHRSLCPVSSCLCYNLLISNSTAVVYRCLFKRLQPMLSLQCRACCYGWHVLCVLHSDPAGVPQVKEPEWATFNSPRARKSLNAAAQKSELTIASAHRHTLAARPLPARHGGRPQSTAVSRCNWCSW